MISLAQQQYLPTLYPTLNPKIARAAAVRAAMDLICFGSRNAKLIFAASIAGMSISGLGYSRECNSPANDIPAFSRNGGLEH